MPTYQDLEPVIQKFKSAKSVYVVIGADPTYDMVAAGLVLADLAQSAGKQVQIACPTPMLVEFGSLVGVEKISDKLGNKNLVISMAYQPDQVEKVSYAISEDGQRFNLIISAASGVSALDPSTISYTLTGAESDLVFLIGVENTNDLRELYEKDRLFFDGCFSLSINFSQSQMLARHHLVIRDQSSFSEAVAWMSTHFSYEPKEDMATNLLSGIEDETKGFTSNETSADTFEIVAKLMKAGGVRIPRRSAEEQAAAQANAQGWFQAQSAPAYVNPNIKQVDPADFAKMLAGGVSSTPQPSPIESEELPPVDAYDGEFSQEGETIEQESVSFSFKPVISQPLAPEPPEPVQQASMPTQSTTMHSNVRRARKAAAAKKQKLRAMIQPAPGKSGDAPSRA